MKRITKVVTFALNSIPQRTQQKPSIPFTIRFLSFAPCEDERRGFVFTAVLASPSNVQLQLPWPSCQFWLGSSGRTTTDCSPCDRAACDSGGTPALSRDVRRAHADAWSPTGGASTAAATKRWIRHKACFLSLLMLIFFFFFFFYLRNLLWSSSSLCRPQRFFSTALAVMCKCTARQSAEEG